MENKRQITKGPDRETRNGHKMTSFTLGVKEKAVPGSVLSEHGSVFYREEVGMLLKG